MDINEIANTLIRGEKAITFPLSIGYVTDVRDANGNHVLDIRGWGRIQYLDPKDDTKGAELQDAIAKWVVATLNKAWEDRKK